MVFVYDLAFILFSIFYLPYLLLKRKAHKHFWTRFGFLDTQGLGLQEKKRIWVHAVSVGEVRVVKGLLTKLRGAYPQHQIVLSVVTQTGFKTACAMVERGDVVIYAPVDLSFAVRRYLDIINPSVYINAETELWPNLLTELKRRAVVVIQVNGRISDGAFGRYQFFKGLLSHVLNSVDLFCMQSETDARRVKALGAAEAKIMVTGNMKFDDLPAADGPRLPSALTAAPGPLFIAGSTHPGEEAIILDIVKAIGGRFPALGLMIAPRHPERALEVMDLCARRGFRAVRFSKMNKPLDPGEVLVVDTIGHLRSLFALAQIVFLGKSLRVGGGHNVIEPAYFGKPVLVGPLMQNFRDIMKLFQQEDAIVQVKDKTQLQTMIIKLLEDEPLRRGFGERALAVIAKNKGATEKTFAAISQLIG